MKTKLVTLALSLFAVTAVAQKTTGLTVSLRFLATRAQTVSGTCCFYLNGGAADGALPLFAHAAAVVEVAGGTRSQVAGTSRGLSTITLLAGPRYVVPEGRLAIAGQALFGAVRGFDADFTSGTRVADTATSFAMALGGFAEYRLTRSVAVRAVQVDFLQTNLPNGEDNRQRNVRLGAGITFRVPLPANR